MRYRLKQRETCKLYYSSDWGPDMGSGSVHVHPKYNHEWTNFDLRGSFKVRPRSPTSVALPLEVKENLSMTL